MWERFGYYVLRAALILYLTQKLRMTEEFSYALFGAFASFLYLSPLAGGLLADRCLGRKWSVIFGGLFLCAGYLTLACPGKTALYAGLAAVIVGNGLFKPNMAGMLGYLYAPTDARREGGFTLFYSGTNLGAMLAALVAGAVIARLGWPALFVTAALGCALGLLIFLFFRPWEQTRQYDLKHGVSVRGVLLSLAALLCCLGGFYGLLLTPQLGDTLILVLGGAFIFHTLRQGFRYQRQVRNNVVACHLLILYVSLLWALGQQAAMSLTIFAEMNVDRQMFGHLFAPETFQAIDPLVIILFGPLLCRLWPRLQAHKRNPGVIGKFFLGTCLMGGSCFLIPLGIRQAGLDPLSAPVWLITTYVLQGLAEIIVAPAGLTMISKLIPKEMTSAMYGVWLYSLALGNLMASRLSELTTVPGKETAANTKALFAALFSDMGIGLLAVGAILLASSRVLLPMLQPAPDDGSTE